ncbi:hypothetical protein C1646_667933 [Rhizophagus diaphanus]|nr:hypothetical protein C1646_667933 [Rhizophagus diaphanus] [Rhizophagus sp. MUCL 43196]
MPLSIFKTKLVRILSNILNSTSKFEIETISAYPLQGYHAEKKPYIRVRIWNHYDQYNALKAVYTIGMCTASDDLICQYYYRKVACEERLPLSSWVTLSNYSYILSENSYLFQISVVHWKDDSNSLKQICLVDVETAPDPRWTTIICKNQVNLLKAFTLYWKLLALDIQIGFNNSQYDWRFIVEKAKKLGVLEWMYNQISLKPSSLEKILKWQYQYSAIKVNNRDFHSKHLKIPGYVAIDV